MESTGKITACLVAGAHASLERSLCKSKGKGNGEVVPALN
jgi:hypothetical protein